MPSLLTTFWQGKADLSRANRTSKPLMIPSGITKLDQKIEAMIDSNLTEDQQNKLMNILKKFSDVFDFSGKSQPVRSKIKHKIDTMITLQQNRGLTECLEWRGKSYSRKLTE
ncbi:hypothetical protein LAZ67_14003476 [Cordylochernes scorpioides]|uniref:Uncharacterized protein n=1 Tax=Cordylochernes scorpioides TaxID=51811 RepID=A0ABY6L7P1_9ARAC|nr:hypothetical protein LAZ67_14003476 [Cordylochernes scorpioides]